MRELSEKELLILSNYLYIDECTKYSTINEMLDSCRGRDGDIDPARVGSLGIGGAMSVDDCTDLLVQMDAGSEDFKSLYAARTIDNEGMRAIAFTGDDPKSATVVFRGTGGTYEAWSDNVKGEYMVDTDIQRMADDFVRYDCGIYDNITTSGHSKGGNLAQYVTVTNGDRVNRCVGFDGQGFGKSFISEYSEEIADNKDKIKIISAYNDYVNILLTPIAGEKVFVENRGNGLVGSHSSYELLKSCEYDKYGNIISIRNQAEGTSILSDVLGITVKTMDIMPDGGNVYASNVLAATVAGTLTYDKGDEYEKQDLDKSLGGLSHYVLGLMGLNNDNDTPGIVANEVLANIDGMRSVAAALTDIIDDIDNNLEKLLEIKKKLDYRAASRLAVDIMIGRVEDRLIKNEERIILYRNTLLQIADLYKECEDSLVEMLL